MSYFRLLITIANDWIFGVGSNRSTNCDTTAVHTFVSFLSFCIHLPLSFKYLKLSHCDRTEAKSGQNQNI